MSSIRLKIYPVRNEYTEFLEKPYPANSKLPEWIKNISLYYTKEKSLDQFNMPTATIKNCMPVRDLISCGFHIPLPCDVWVDRTFDNEGNQHTNFRWALPNLPLIEPHMEIQSKGYPIHKEFEKMPFKFNNFWIIETPPNWSCLFTHPSYYEDLPFRTLGGLVDTDNFPLSVNFPFFLKKDFVGLIPKGTPIAQVIPFKRENFKLRFKKYDNSLLYRWYKASSSFFNIYKNNFRAKKSYSIEKCPFHSLIKK
jgi:hypothetical protein